MFEGKYTRWGIWAAGHDLAGDASIELLRRNFSSDDLLQLIDELKAIRRRMVLRERPE